MEDSYDIRLTRERKKVAFESTCACPAGLYQTKGRLLGVQPEPATLAMTSCVDLSTICNLI
ncbi:hypothetical protein CCACVL1_09225 [Corchorus capsularis]|uniref:Uncharacterized protein n=1 Tax=Corchorus capsularis TaxID=210143 RepID=A0A1R3IXB5_COCAP|nr:hypothetical protein CCACVL1_09225 [Corchorus capsularis]